MLARAVIYVQRFEQPLFGLLTNHLNDGYDGEIIASSLYCWGKTMLFCINLNADLQCMMCIFFFMLYILVSSKDFAINLLPWCTIHNLLSDFWVFVSKVFKWHKLQLLGRWYAVLAVRFFLVFCSIHLCLYGGLRFLWLNMWQFFLQLFHQV